MTQSEQRQRPLEALSDVLGGSVDFVWQAKARAEAARERALAAQQGQQAGPVQIRETSAEAEAMVLALMRRFGSAPDVQPPARASAPARAPASVPARVAKLSSGRFALPDDGTRADGTWLHFELGQVPAFGRGNALRQNLATKDHYPRGVWRAALARVLQRPSSAVCNPVGLLIASALETATTGKDPRCSPTYCASPGWGPAAYRAAGVEGEIHTRDGCRCHG